MKNLNKRITVFIMVFFLLMPIVSKAQIYLSSDDEEFNSMRDGTAVWFEGGIPYPASDYDQFVPLGDGIIMLTFGAAFMLARSKKKRQN